jgi:hypothetical protein
MKDTEAKNITVNTVLMGETVYLDLPIPVRILIAAYATPIPSGNEGVFSFEVAGDHWNEIKSELTRSEQTAGDRASGFVLATYYANDYYCPRDDASWSRCNCDSAEPDECPICDRMIEPVASDRYIVIRRTLEGEAVCGPATEPVPMCTVPSEPARHNSVLVEGGGER